MIKEAEFKRNLERLRSRMNAACREVGRESSAVQLLPVTKNHPVDAIEYAVRSGLTAVGENRVQEAGEKQAQCRVELRWELIGHLQSNKAKQAVDWFDRIQSVDSIKLLRRLDRFAGEAERVLPVLLQCNTGQDPNKYGFRAESMGAAVEAALEASHLQLDGLMTVAPLDDDPDVAEGAFVALRELRDSLSETFGVGLRELSMGMTGDLESAIAAGSTQIRVGTALFGARKY